MIPIDLFNADVAGYQIFYALLIIKSLYLIGYNHFQSSVKHRVLLFKALRILYIFVVLPLYALLIFILVRQYFHDDYKDFKFSRVYWKAATLFMVLVITAIILFILSPTVRKAIKFLKKNDRNEVKYQQIFKKTRSTLIVLIIIDILMLLFLNRVVS